MDASKDEVQYKELHDALFFFFETRLEPSIQIRFSRKMMLLRKIFKAFVSWMESTKRWGLLSKVKLLTNSILKDALRTYFSLFDPNLVITSKKITLQWRSQLHGVHIPTLQDLIVVDLVGDKEHLSRWYGMWKSKKIRRLPLYLREYLFSRGIELVPEALSHTLYLYNQNLARPIYADEESSSEEEVKGDKRAKPQKKGKLPPTKRGKITLVPRSAVVQGQRNQARSG